MALPGGPADKIGRARILVGWIIDRLREERIDVDADGTPVPPTDQPAELYRWGTLLTATDDPAVVWEKRFAGGSWLRRQFEEAHEGLQGWMVKVSSRSDNESRASPTAMPSNDTKSS
jgi:hypothetical protein